MRLRLEGIIIKLFPSKSLHYGYYDSFVAGIVIEFDTTKKILSWFVLKRTLAITIGPFFIESYSAAAITSYGDSRQFTQIMVAIINPFLKYKTYKKYKKGRAYIKNS